MGKDKYSENFSNRAMWKLIVLLENSKVWKALGFLAITAIVGILVAIFV